MKPLLAITWLTLKAALRYRLVLVLSVILLSGVVILPLILKDDGTARGFTQILLTYTLSMVTALLGFATLWLSCGTLAREVEEAQMQMVVVKPIARWKVWFGKWLGILALNLFLMTLACSAVYALLLYRAGKLPEAQQRILKNEVMVARAAVREPIPDYQGDVERIFRERLAETQGPDGPDPRELRRIVEEQVKAAYQIVRPGYQRVWKIDFGLRKHLIRDQPMYIRAKFNAAQKSESGTYTGFWEVGPPESGKQIRRQMSLAPDTFHEFELPANMFDDNGILTIHFLNMNESALLFPLEEGLEVLYRESGFGLNYIRGVAILFCWLALLAAIGLAAASFLSFPVAAFASIAVLIVAFSSGTLKQIVEDRGIMGVDHETGQREGTIADIVAVPVASGLLKIVNLARDFSPVDALSTGRSITWGTLARAVVQICLLMGGLFAVIGISIFSRRELAAAQGMH